MGIYKLNFLLNFYPVIIHQNIDIGIEYFLEKVLNLTFSAETTNHEFCLNFARVTEQIARDVDDLNNICFPIEIRYQQ